MPSPTAVEPPSPCIGVCTLDAARICTGCGRSLDEIAIWSAADVPVKQAIVTAAARRLVMIRTDSDSGERAA